ncbi:hypothetical protein JVU11DRAFT_3251 [Chiua virens]|nr:hypothetical protein JVU11DRAFT_3251 [Chiua virens]
MISFTRFFLLTFLFSSVFALPVALQVSQRDVVDPQITSPGSTTVWHVNAEETVTWSTTGLPANQTNPVGRLVLGYLYNNSENLMLDSPLATNINYSVGYAQITVPNVPTRDDYIVVLFGDSGNASPKFTIINDASSSTFGSDVIDVPCFVGFARPVSYYGINAYFDPTISQSEYLG